MQLVDPKECCDAQVYRQHLQSTTGCLRHHPGCPGSLEAPRAELDPAALSWLLLAGTLPRGTGQHHSFPVVPFIQQQCLWCPLLHVMPAELIDSSVSS